MKAAGQGEGGVDPMTGPTPTTSRRPSPVLLGVIALVVVSGVVLYRYGLAHPAAPEPPNPDLSQADYAVREAIAGARERVLEDPGSADAWGRLGMAFYAHVFGPEATACFEQAEALDPDNPRWPYFQALILRSSDPPAALPKLHRAVELVRDETDRPRLLLGELYLMLGESGRAREHLQAVLHREPEHPRAHLGLARLEYQDGDPAVCREYLKYAADSPFTRKAALLLSAEVHQRAGDPAAARRDRAKAATLPDDPEWPDRFLQEVAVFEVGEAARLRQAGRWLAGGRVGEAVHALRGLIREYPRSARARTQLGIALCTAGRAADAERELLAGLDLDPAQPNACRYLGLIRRRQGDRADAIGWFRKAIALRPSDEDAHINLGLALTDAGDLPAATAAFEAALRCQPLSAAAHAQLGALLLKQGRTDAAVPHLRQAVELNPEDAGSRKLLEQLRK